MYELLEVSYLESRGTLVSTNHVVMRTSQVNWLIISRAIHSTSSEIAYVEVNNQVYVETYTEATDNHKQFGERPRQNYVYK